MKIGTWTTVGIAASLVGFALPVASVAQNSEANTPKHHHYKLIDLGTLGGSRSYFSPGSGQLIGQFSHVLNNRGTAVGFANTPLPDPFFNFCFDIEGDCLLTHAFQTQGANGLTDLGASEAALRLGSARMDL
jgi:hypothetical protein